MPSTLEIILPNNQSAIPACESYRRHPSLLLFHLLSSLGTSDL
ncbi:hypothetical protein RMSM_07610 [Rhodopirellula maiorica SM1]|uniref:Uncharacterized protein n=1 Tax=Rhodopirellula maiorica SM1 TaxID=1265738 RepID=M5R7K5_9BACT|nr:hypothetical protein RMSM_07610 [Rhodopirellula maiorica SM1]